jgi:transposase-like protein/IS1 family transposase
MVCHNCQTEAKKHGTSRQGTQCFRCRTCSKTFIEPQTKPLDTMRLRVDEAISVISLLVEGCSIRSIERVTGVHRDTILDLLVLTGTRCERLLENRVRNIAVKDVQADEIWGFVAMKEKTKKAKGSDNPFVGDPYCFIAIERETKLILAWHLGRRSAEDTMNFTEKLNEATQGHFQLTTDGFAPYNYAVSYSLGTRVDFAQLIKVYAGSREGEQRYSPAVVQGTIRQIQIGNPVHHRICTSHIERANLGVRTSMRRMTRLTNGFSRKWENLKAAYALYFAHYNFCRVHGTLRVTPAMETGITDHIWSLSELLCN